MSEKTLFLAWQDKKPSRAWFPVGQLDADVEHSMYRFRYIKGARKAKKEGFTPLLDFPELKGDYRSSELFPLFRNRVMNPARPDFSDYLQSLDLPDKAKPHRDPGKKWWLPSYRYLRSFPKTHKACRREFYL